MGIKKSKIQLIEKDIDNDIKDDIYQFYHRYDDIYDWDYDDYDSIPDDACWTYVNPTMYDNNYIIRTFRYRREIIRPYKINWEIDMDSIYPKNVLRCKKIDKILGDN